MSGKSLAETTRNDFGSLSNKRMKEMSIDRLSALPDSLVIHILSFLGVKKSAVTSVLSKRWEFIWTELPELRFNEDSRDRKKRLEFLEMVDRTLRIRTGIHLEKFDVHFRYNESFDSVIDSWVDFVSKHTVKEFGLRLYPQGGFYPRYIVDQVELYSLPETMYSNSSLKRFSMGRCRLDTLTNIEWKSLIWLHINSSELKQHVVENILSGSPSLHTLELKQCWGFSCLEVKSRNLHELKICECDEEHEENGPLLEISAPYVHTLDITCSLDQRKLVLRNTESVVRAKIDFTGFGKPEYEKEVESLTKELYAIVLQCKEVDLGRQYFEVLSDLVAYGWQLPVSRLKCLTIHTSSEDEFNISGIFALLKFSPNLEMLAIEGVEPGEEIWCDAVKVDLDCDLLHLKTVRMSEFANPAFGGEPMITVARTLLKRATVLEEMTVTLRAEDTDDYLEIGQTLFTYPRSSEKAIIEFHEVILQLRCQL